MGEVMDVLEKGIKCVEKGLNIILGTEKEMCDMKKTKDKFSSVTANAYSRRGILNKSTVFAEEVLDKFRENVGMLRAETGGMIGSKKSESCIDLFVFDEHSKNSLASFYYDTESMSIVFRDWKSKGYVTNGFVHSHPIGAIRPSYHDISTALLHMDFFKLDYFMMPIIQNDRKGLYTMYFYIARKEAGVVTTELQYVLKATNLGYEYIPFEAWSETHFVSALSGYRKNYNRTTAEHKGSTKVVLPPGENKNVTENDKVISKGTHDESKEYFTKVEGLLPEKVKDKVIICVGAGGAREYLENMARNGFKNYILIEHDTVGTTNVATQAVYISEMGRSKVEVIKERILDINPEANVICVDKFLDDQMSDDEFESYMLEFKDRKATDYLILGCTDNFEAQERCAALALKFGTPYLAAMMYKGGAGAEIIFTYPGVTPSCPRCLLRSRYEDYEHGYKNDVDSSSCSYFATSVMNAYKGYISLMLLAYHEAPQSEYNDMLDAVKDRNFVWIRLSPNIKEALGIGLFDKAFSGAERYTFMGEPIWVPQTPDNEANGTENCKLCGGNGNLKILYNKWPDTRKICGVNKFRRQEETEKVKMHAAYLPEHKASGFNAYV